MRGTTKDTTCSPKAIPIATSKQIQHAQSAIDSNKRVDQPSEGGIWNDDSKKHTNGFLTIVCANPDVPNGSNVTPTVLAKRMSYSNLVRVLKMYGGTLPATDEKFRNSTALGGGGRRPRSEANNAPMGDSARRPSKNVGCANENVVIVAGNIPLCLYLKPVLIGRDHRGITGHIWACLVGREDVVRLLVEAGHADFNGALNQPALSQNSKSILLTLLIAAVFKGSKELTGIDKDGKYFEGDAPIPDNRGHRVYWIDSQHLSDQESAEKVLNSGNKGHNSVTFKVEEQHGHFGVDRSNKSMEGD
ncbi:hypothetical protein BJ742DRAFT_739908 [Cladochytrium replicatum]|nr:hypothetical protein BJ742DRAFT_739908 [Cladochytrium replicatum]